MTTPPVALTIAGSDSGGGAGVQADLRTFAALGVHGACALAALTAQSTVGVDAVHVVPVDFLLAQVSSVTGDLHVRATKTGMLATADHVRAVADLARRREVGDLVVDPVMVASSGARLLDAGAEAAYRDDLLPTARVATPNRLEAAVLVDGDLVDRRGVHEAARALAALGTEVVVVTGGDRADGDAVDVVATSDATWELRAPAVDTGNVHGTGCSFAAAIAARLAHGDAPLDAVMHAKGFVHRALLGAARWQLGAGPGPIDHLGWSAAQGQPASSSGRGTPGAAVRARMPSVARSADSGMIGKMSRSRHTGSMSDQS